MAVADVRKAVAWYTKVLGLVEHVRIGEGHRAQLGRDGERAEMIVREYRTGGRPSPTSQEVMFRVDDVDTVLEAARQAGADAGASHDWEYGERQASFVDPFGHLWLVGDRSPLSVHPEGGE